MEKMFHTYITKKYDNELAAGLKKQSKSADVGTGERLDSNSVDNRN